MKYAKKFQKSEEEDQIFSEPEKQSAERLANSLEPWRFSVPAGPVMEIGAGSGSFTHYLTRFFPGRKILVSDRSEKLITLHKRSFSVHKNLSWQIGNPEKDNPDEDQFALICGNQVAHTFEQSAQTLEKLSRSLKMDGIMLMAFPGEDSFKEWRSVCIDLGIPYTGRKLPGTEPLVIHLSMGPVQVDFYEDQSKVYFDSFHQFLKYNQSSGFPIQKGERKLTLNEIEMLNEHWKDKKNDKIGLSYHNVFLAVKRIGK